MKFIDDIDNNELEKEMETALDDKKDQIFYAMLNGQTVTDEIKTSRGEFFVRFPKQKDVISIGRIAAFLRNGMPATSFDAATEYEIQKCAALDVMIASGPAWFENAKKKTKNFSWKDVPDAHFVDEVYAKALQFRKTIQRRIAENQEIDSEKADGEIAGDVSAAVGNGLFQDASGSAKRA